MQVLQNGAAVFVFWKKTHVPWTVSGDFVVLEAHEFKGSKKKYFYDK